MFAFADRGDEPGDQDTLAAGLLKALVDLGPGDPAQDRLQDLVVAGERLAWEQPKISPSTSSLRLCRSPNSTELP